MTTIVAVRKEDSVCIACDSLATWGRRKEVAGEVAGGGAKVVRFGPNLVGVSGYASWNLILERYFAAHPVFYEWRSVDEVWEGFSALHAKLMKEYYYRGQKSSITPIECSDYGLLIANSHGIFEVDYLRTVRHYCAYTAIGTGEHFAVGALKASYDRVSAVESARIALEAASKFDRKTALPMYIWEVNSASPFVLSPCRGS